MEANKHRLRNIFIGIFAAILLYCGLMQTEKVAGIIQFIKNMLAPFIVGGVIAFILNVPMRRIEGFLKFIKKDGLRRTISITLTFVFVGLILTVVFLLLIPEVINTISDIKPVLEKFFAEDAKNYINSLLAKYPAIKYKFLNYINGGFDFESILSKAFSIIGTSIDVLFTGISSVVGIVSSLLMDTFVAVVFTVYCLSQKEVLARQGRKILYASVKEKYADQVVRILRMTNSAFSNFLSGQCIEVVILGSMFAVSMAIFRMPYIPLISVLIAVTAFIPIVGAWIGCVVGAFLMLVTDPIQAVWFVLLFLALQQIENHLIYPKVVGNSIGLSGMWVLIAVAVGGELFGVAGMFLMIPMTSVIYTLVSEFANSKVLKKNIDPDKLRAHPPELKSKIKEKIKKKRELRKSANNSDSSEAE